MRQILPVLSFGLLIGTYLISALIMGIFHAQNAPNIGFMVAAFLVPLSIQLGRGTLVFFFQLNPMQILSRYSIGIIAATALLVLSLVEAIILLMPYGLSWIVSVSTLMMIGYIIEIMILKETHFASQWELYHNQSQWEELKRFYLARHELESFSKEMKGKAPSSLLTLPSNTLVQVADEEKNILEGKVQSPAQNGQVNHH